MDKCNVLVVPLLVPAAASHTVLATGLTSGASDSAAITIRKACEATAVSTAAGSPAGVAGYANDDASTPAVDETLFNDPWRVAFRLDQSGQLLVADKSNFVVRTVAIDGSLPRSALLSGIPGQRGLADGFNDKPGPKFAELVGLGQIVAEPTGNGT